MILSTSSSRAVSIRIGTSELLRIRRQTSIPSMSGSIRSSTISAGVSAATSAGGACAGAAGGELVVAGRGGLHPVTWVLQVERDERRDRALVLDDEHGLGTGCARCP